MSKVNSENKTVYTVELSQDEANLLADVLVSGVLFNDTELGLFAENLWDQLTSAGASDVQSVSNDGVYLVQVAE